MHSRRRDLGIFWFLSALWSGNWLWIKVGLAGLPPFRFTGLRMALACLLLAPFVLKPPPAFRRGARPARGLGGLRARGAVAVDAGIDFRAGLPRCLAGVLLVTFRPCPAQQPAREAAGRRLSE